MKFIHLFLVISILISTPVHSQMNVSVRKKEFKTEKPAFREAWKHADVTLRLVDF